MTEYNSEYNEQVFSERAVNEVWFGFCGSKNKVLALWRGFSSRIDHVLCRWKVPSSILGISRHSKEKFLPATWKNHWLWVPTVKSDMDSVHYYISAVIKVKHSDGLYYGLVCRTIKHCQHLRNTCSPFPSLFLQSWSHIILAVFLSHVLSIQCGLAARELKAALLHAFASSVQFFLLWKLAGGGGSLFLGPRPQSDDEHWLLESVLWGAVNFLIFG